MQLNHLPLDIGVHIVQFLNFTCLLEFLTCSKSCLQWGLQPDALSDLNASFFQEVRWLLKKQQEYLPTPSLDKDKKKKKTRGFTQLRVFTFDYWGFLCSSDQNDATSLSFTELGYLSRLCHESLHRNGTLQSITLQNPPDELLRTFSHKR